MSILNRIIYLLKEQEKQQKDLTDFLGVHKNAFTDWKSGKSKSYTKYLYQIADYLGTTPEYLRGETDEKEKPTADEGDELSELLLELKGIITDMTENQKDALLDYAKYLKSKE